MSSITHLKVVLLGMILATVLFLTLFDSTPAHAYAVPPPCESCTCKFVKVYMYKSEIDTLRHWYYKKNEDDTYTGTTSALTAVLTDGDCDANTYRAESTDTIYFQHLSDSAEPTTCGPLPKVGGGTLSFTVELKGDHPKVSTKLIEQKRFVCTKAP